jgi:hypothetical protein
MKLLLALVIILVISVLGSRITFLNRRLSLGFRNILLTGTEYIFIGVLLGSVGFNILDAGALKKMEPFLIIGLCWVGFLFGLQFKVRQLKTLPRFYFAISAVQALVTFLFVSVFMFFVLKSHIALQGVGFIMVVLTLGSSSSCTAQSALAIVGQNYKFKNRRLLDLMRYISGIDGFYALIFFACAMSIFPGGEITGFNLYASIKWLLISALLGVVPALIFISLSRTRFSQQEFFVFLIGTVIFCGGLVYQVQYSPLISGLVCGVFTANFSRHRLRALSEILHAEKSIYIILLLLLGAGWSFKADYILLVSGVYIIARTLGKYVGTYFGVKIFKPGFHVPSTLGFGLMSEGGHAAAIIMSFKLLYPDIAAPLFTIVIISIIFNELVSPWFILLQFDKNERTLLNLRREMAKKREQI